MANNITDCDRVQLGGMRTKITIGIAASTMSNRQRELQNPIDLEGTRERYMQHNKFKRLLNKK